MRKWGIILLAVLAFACKKDDDEFDPVPVITFSGISDTEVLQFQNDVSITFGYRDMDGDLGFTDPDEYAMRIKDSRLAEWDWYHIPPLTPEDMNLDIQGDFTVDLHALFLLGNGQQEITSFTLQIQDRAGNWSNQIVTPEVLITDTL